MRNQTLDHLRDSLEAASDMTGVKSSLKDLAADLGFEWFAYLSVCGTEVETFSTYPRAWQRNYLANGYAGIDPVVQLARTATGCYAWSEGKLDDDLSREGRCFFGEARAFGITSGVSVPIRAGFGRSVLFTLASSGRPDNCLEDCPLAAEAIGLHVDVYVRRWMLEPAVAQGVRLTQRERVCLAWTAKGKRMSEVAQIIGTTTRTVEYHLQNAREKLGAVNLTHAVALAVRQKLV
ncbi:autoinducer binding domain-containing protein (plasmid) [Pelagibacterium nitratireducens]|uniref:Autoinducer binding domain-containing protein n=1 Tax=Pelagibacterium nitratireducens TaxID=1046114 RepID=A0ABZ2I9C3_9HYPH